MTEDRLSQWLDLQQRLINAGVAASQIRLEGPDSTPWGTWPIDLEDLPGTIRLAMTTLGEELPNGRHAARLIALDGEGNQLSVLPRAITGHCAMATSHASESVTYAKASAMVQQTAEQALLSLTNRAESAETRALELSEAVLALVQTVTEMQADGLDQELKRQESAAKADAFRMIGKSIAESLGPLTAIFAEGLATKLLAGEVANGGGQEPTNGSTGNSTDTTASAPTDGASSDLRDSGPGAASGRAPVTSKGRRSARG